MNDRTAIYARVSTADQNIDAQISELVKFCESKGFSSPAMFQEKTSGVGEREELNKLLGECLKGNFARIVIYDLSRMSRKGVADAIETIKNLQEKGVDLISMSEGLSFDGQMGLVMASMLSAFSNIDYELRREKQRIGIERSRELNGGKCPWGGARRQRDPSHDLTIKKLRKTGLTIRKIAKTLNVSPTTVQRSLKHNKAI
jgi:DNA invertase Pin-like site-specific DNA recombinase